MSSRSSERAAVRTLLDLARSAEPFCSDLGQPFFAIPLTTDTSQAYPIRPGYLAIYLTARYLQHCGEPPPESALRHVLRTLEARAFAEGRREPLFPRVGWRPHTFMGPAIFLNLANNAGEYICINSERWESVRDSSTYFAHHRGQPPLPRPPDPPSRPSLEDDLPDVRSDEDFFAQPDPGQISRLRSFFPCDEPAWHRCLAWLFAALHPSISYPVLILQGPPASGKSTAARLLRALLDPSTAPLLDLPNSRRRIYTLAARQWIVAFDHVSEIPRPASSALCRLSTGADHHFRDHQDLQNPFLRDFRRPVLITACTGLALQPDLASRALLARFPAIPPESRRTEAALWQEFETHAPAILAALCSAASIALRRLPEIQLPKSPVRADAVSWVLAAAPALGLTEEQVLAVFDPVDPDPLAGALCEFMLQRPEWHGSAAELLDQLRPSLGDAAPDNPRGLSQRLRRLAPTSLTIEFNKSHGNRSIRVAQSTPETPKFAPPDALSPNGS